MVRHAWSVLCQIAIIEKDTNITSYINTFSGLELKHGAELPVLLPPFVVGTCWWRDSLEPVSFDIRVTIKGPTKKEEIAQLVHIDMSAGIHNHRQNIKVEGLPCHKLGRHLIKIELLQPGLNKWKKVATLPFVVSVRQPEIQQIDQQ